MATLNAQNVVPETDNVEIAIIAAALHLTQNVGSQKAQLEKFKEAYQAVRQAVNEAEESGG